MQKRQRNVQISVMHGQSFGFAYKTYCFFDVLVAVRVVGSLSPYRPISSQFPPLTVPEVFAIVNSAQFLSHFLSSKLHYETVLGQEFSPSFLRDFSIANRLLKQSHNTFRDNTDPILH